MKETMLNCTRHYQPYLLAMRREFHMYPELSLHETRTARRIMEELQQMGIPCKSIAETGVIGTITGGYPGKTIALRADIDALAIEEERDAPYASQQPGVMHACGHDAHAAMLLGAAKVLSEKKEQLHGRVQLLFQPGEEGAHGAQKMIEAGALEGVDEIFGLHVMGIVPSGMVAFRPGAMMASADSFRITVNGLAGHGGMPHLSVDALLAASAVVLNLQSIPSRQTPTSDPVVLSVGKSESGTQFNAIAGTAIMEGTVRCFSHENRAMVSDAVSRIAKSTCEAYRAQAQVDYEFLAAPVINHPDSAQRAKEAVSQVLSEQAVISMDPTTGADDFSEYLKHIPGVFVLLGTGDKEKDTCYSIHHPKFDIDEDMLHVGAALHCQYAWEYLNNTDTTAL